MTFASKTSSEYRHRILQKQDPLRTKELFYPRPLIIGHTHDPGSRLLQVGPSTHQTPLQYPRSSCYNEFLGRSPLKPNGAAGALILLSANARFNKPRLDALGGAYLNPTTFAHVFDKATEDRFCPCA